MEGRMTDWMDLSDLQDSRPYYFEGDELEFLGEADLNQQFGDLTLKDDDNDEDEEEIEDKPDPAKIREFALFCVKDYNAEEGNNLEFVRVKQAERFRACGGYIYCLTIIVQNDRREESAIEKMVWLGKLMEVIRAEKKTISIEQKQGNANLKEDYELGVALTVFYDGTLWPERVISSKEISNPRHINRGEGYIDSSSYEVSVVAKYPHIHQSEIVIEGAVRRTTWGFPLNKHMTDSLRTWRKSTREFGPPLEACLITSEDPRSYKPEPSVYVHNLDLISPQILTQAWFAVENYNLKSESNLEFVKVERAAVQLWMGTTYRLVISVKERQSCKTYTTEVHEIDFASLWKCTSPFVPNEDPLGRLVPFHMRISVYRIASK